MAFSEYLALWRQNRKDRVALNDLDKNSVDRAKDWLKAVSWNSYEVELVVRDLILMAAEADRQGKTLRETLGDEDAFYSNLADSIDHGNLLDYVTGYFAALTAAVGAIGVLIFAVVPGTGPMDAGTLLVQLLGQILVATCTILFARQFLPPRSKGHLGAKIVLGVLDLLAIAFVCTTWIWRDAFRTFPLSPITVCLLLMAVGLLLLLLRVVRYNLLAARHPWRENSRT